MVLFHPELSITLPGNIISSPKVLFLSDQEYKEHFIPKGKGLEIKCTHMREGEVTYLYISGKVTIPKQSEFNVNSYNKDTVNFVNANVLI